VTSTILALSTATTILVLVASLLVLAALMTGVAVWLIRSTRRDTPALGPLEVMGDRSWRRGDADRRAELLAGARPEGAPEPAPMLDEGPEEESEEEPEVEVEPDIAVAAADDIEVEVLHRYDPADG